MCIIKIFINQKPFSCNGDVVRKLSNGVSQGARALYLSLH